MDDKIKVQVFCTKPSALDTPVVLHCRVLGTLLVLCFNMSGVNLHVIAKKLQLESTLFSKISKMHPNEEE